MLGLELVVVLGMAVLACTTLGSRYRVAPPVLMLGLGVVLGLVPRLSQVQLPPEVVLLLFLPAILYWESLNTSLREIRANLRIIVLHSVALVVLTAAAVAAAAHALGMDARAAWVLGAVLAPTDATAVAGLARQMPRRTLTVLRAESLINDGTALVLFGIAVAAARSGQHVGAPELAERLVVSYAGGFLVGILTARLIVLIRRRLDDPLREGAVSVLTPFVAFLGAELVQASGVVAVVVCGLALSQVGPRLVRARARVLAFSFWELATFLLNGALFVLLGLQLPGAARALDETSPAEALVIALVISAVVIATRMLWMHTLPYAIRALDRRPAQRLRRVGWRQRTAGGWAGFRGAVSLAAALAVPATTADGAPFPDRHLIVFITSVVILVTILVQGLTLPAVIRWARLPEDTARAEELRLAQVRAAEAGLAALPQVAARLGVDGTLLERLRAEYEGHAAAVRADDTPPADGAGPDLRALDRQLRLGVLAHKRAAVVQLRDERRIDDIVLREVQAAMDLEELRLAGPVDRD